MNKNIYETKIGFIISPYYKSQDKDLEKKTAIEDKVYYRWDPYVGFIGKYNGVNSFITFKDKNMFKSGIYKDYNVIQKGAIIPQTLKYNLTFNDDIVLRSIQIETLGEMKLNNVTSGSWYVNMQTGEGKTTLAIYVNSVVKLKTMVFCYSVEILKQWKNAYCTTTDIDPERILILSGPIIDKLLSGKLDIDDYDIYLTTPGLIISKSDGEYGYIENLMSYLGIGLSIYDEAHRHVSSLVKIFSTVNIQYQLFLSAETKVGSKERAAMFRRLLKNIQIIRPSDDSIKSMKYTRLAVLKYDTKPTSLQQLSIYSKYGYSELNYMEYQINCGYMSDMIHSLLHNIVLKDRKYRSLVLFPYVKNVEMYYDYLQATIGNDFKDLKIGRFHGKVPDSEKLDVKDNADIIVATYASFGTGLDTKDIKYVISTAQCNEVADNQAAGRARPLSDGSHAIYFMCVDYGFEYCTEKLKRRLKYLNSTKSNDNQVYIYDNNTEENEDDGINTSEPD